MTFTDPAERERIHDDLKGVVRGGLLFDDLTRALFSTDASPFQITPLGVVQPADEDDVRAVVRYAREHQVPLVARGAGTGVAGESLGPGLVIDLSRHLRRIVEVGTDTVTVQPGVVLRALRAELATVGRRLGPDPGHAECTLGGMVATNASGSRALRFGYTRDHVERLRVVLDTGDVAETGRHPRWPAAVPGGARDRLDDIVAALFALLDEHADAIKEHRPRTPWNRCGYLLHDVLYRGNLDLARLLVGTEGTLALTTEATLRTVPLPGGRAVVLLGCENVETAVRAAARATAAGPVACDLLDRRLLQLLRGGPAATAGLIPVGVEALLLIEFEGHAPAEARAAAGQLADALRRDRLALWARLALNDDDVAATWQLRDHAVEQLYAQRGSVPPATFVEDVAVPTPALVEYLVKVQAVLRKHEVTATFLLHAATGQVHMRPFLDLDRRADASLAWSLADDVYRLVLDLGGTVSTQHGTGLARTPWVEAQYGPLVEVFRQVKAIFDPGQIFNPGKIVGKSSGVPFWPLRGQGDKETPTTPTSPGVATPGADDPPEPPARLLVPLPALLEEAQRCNGCGECRSTSPAQRMCPIFRVLPTEEATPRAKANLLRHLLRGDADPRALASDEARAIADLCVNCRMCARECPAQVDIPRLMLAAKAANAEQHGLDRADAVLARTESYAWLGSLLAPFINAALGTRPFRWYLEKFFGLSSRRRLPAFAATNFLRRAQRRGWTRKPAASGRPRVAYFVDLFATYNDPSIGEAVVAVLHHNGVEVYVPPRQHGCGMAPLAVGDLDTARDILQANFRELADLAREGYPILCAEPTAAVLFRDDARVLLPGPDADLIAQATVEFTAYLWGLHQQGRLRTDFRPLPLALGHHVPCHIKALGGPVVGPDLLRLVPELRVHTIDVGCSGMAGTYGLRADAYDTSMAAGAAMLAELARPRVVFGSTECGTCRIQMEDGSNKRTLHPAQYLAMAYGLMPELRERLERPVGRRVL